MYYETLDLKIDFNSSICEGILLFSLILMHDITILAQKNDIKSLLYNYVH